MLKLKHYKAIFAITGLVGILLFASPTLSLVLHLPGGEKFSELWILGPTHVAGDVPFNVRANETYTIYLGVGNYMESSAYYIVEVKFRNQTDPFPDPLSKTPNTLNPIFEYRVFLGDNDVWEREIAFSFENVSFKNNTSTISSIVIDGHALHVDKDVAWDQTNNGFNYELFFELWLYNAPASSFQYNDRVVGLQFNMTDNKTL
ncbi:MAG: DUF1616 domain-containing protein [Candidatus Bathyarchaeia archaeon]